MSASVFSRYCFFFKQKTAYEMRISDWSSDVCSSDLAGVAGHVATALIRVDLADHHLHQGRFARAVAADEADAAARRQRGAGAVENSAAAAAHGDAVQVEHGGGL